MPAPVETYPALRRFRLDLPPDATVYEQGTIPAFFYLLLTGRVVFEVLDATGSRTVGDEVLPGGTFGVVGAFSGRSTSAAARTTARTQLLAIPVSAAVEAFRQAPEFAVAVVKQFANQQRPARSVAAPTDPDELALEAAEPPADLHLLGGVDDASESLGVEQHLPLDVHFNEQWFFEDEVQCPVCRNSFSYLRVRASAVRPAQRESDFRIAYKTVDPSLYAIVVCPHCAYASYVEDFTELSTNERRVLVASRSERQTRLPRTLCGERTIDDALLSLEIAQECAEVRGAGLRRRAGLLHRRAWLERGRGNVASERTLLEGTRDAYRTVYEQDPDIQDASAMRVAYLIGDLTLRLGDVGGARQWFLECIRMKTTSPQDGLIRMARTRLEDAKDAQTGSLARSA
jgi:uncharacterized protein